MYKKIRKDILKRNLTLCIVSAMYIALEVIEWVTIAFVQDHNALIAAMAVVFEYYFSMLGMTDIYIYIPWCVLCYQVIK